MTTSQAISQLRLVLRRQHKALSTEKSYTFWLQRFMSAVFQMPTNLSSEQKLERFLSDLARDRDVSASTQNQAFNAILFFYLNVLHQQLGNVDSLRAQRPVHERHAPTLAQTQALLSTVRNEGGYPTNLIARLLYGCGLRVTEPLNLRIKDIDLESQTLCIRGAKGGQDRVVPLPASLIPELTQQIEFARAVWQRDQHNRTPLMLPNRLARKYPDYQFRWTWAWLFPAHHPCRDPWTGTIVRFRMHEANVQRAVKKASRQLGISVLPHELRHGYASHCLARGANPRAIQKVMGHKSLETTMGYFHAEALSVNSPLDLLPMVPPNRVQHSVHVQPCGPEIPTTQNLVPCPPQTEVAHTSPRFQIPAVTPVTGKQLQPSRPPMVQIPTCQKVPSASSPAHLKSRPTFRQTDGAPTAHRPSPNRFPDTRNKLADPSVPIIAIVRPPLIHTNPQKFPCSPQEHCQAA